MPPLQTSLGPTALTARPQHTSVEFEPPVRGPVEPRRRRTPGKAWLSLSLSAVTALGVVAGMHQSTAPKPQIVSGRAGPKLTVGGVPERWWTGDLTVTVDESMSGVWPDATAGIETAFDRWRTADDRLPRITFDARKASAVLLEPDGENRIYYAPITLPGHENDLAITLQYTNQDSGEIVESDIVVNSHHPFAVLVSNEESDAMDDSKGNGSVGSCNAKYDVTSIVTHEIGHFWGLGEDMVDTKATMYFSTPPCNVMKRKLKTDDVTAVSSLYSVAAPASSASQTGHCAVTTLGSRSTSGGLVVSAALIVGAGALRRRRRSA